MIWLTCLDIAGRHKLHRCGRGWRGDCPACGYAGAFSMHEGLNATPLLYCASCQDRNAVIAAVGMPPRERMNPAAPADDDAKRSRKFAAAMRLWQASVPTALTAASIYLVSRSVGHLVDCPELRFHHDCPNPEGGRYPALVAIVRSAAGEPLAIHRTFLRPDGAGKADIECPRASLGPVWGGAVWLASVATEMAIGEGIETAAAAGLLTGLPALAAISAGNLAAGLVLPVAVRTVTIAVDREPAGERAARSATARWRAEGRRVHLLVPDDPGTDAADVLKAREVPHG